MIIRKVTPNDNFQLKQVKPGLSDEMIDDRITRQKLGEVEYLVLEENGRVVSFVLLKYGGKETHPKYPDMEDLYTMETERGKGYGSLLVKECECLVKERGFSKIGLAVNPTENNSARRLYERLGYRHDGEKSYVDAIYDGVEDWCIDMEKTL